MLKYDQMTENTMKAADLTGLRTSLDTVLMNDRRFHERLKADYSDESWSNFWEETNEDWRVFLNQIKKVLDAVMY